MQASEDTAPGTGTDDGASAPESRSDSGPSASAAPADLGRLRINRGAEDVARVRGVPWIRLFLLAGLVLLVVLFREPLMGLLGGGGTVKVQTALAVKVVPGQAEAGDVAANGYIVADKQASLASVLSGRLVELHADEGMTVQAGAVVARIQFDDLEVQERQAIAQREAAEAAVAEAQSAVASATARVTEAKKNQEAAALSDKRLDAEIRAQADVVDQAREARERLEREVERNRTLWRDKRIDLGTWDRVQTQARTARLAHDAATKRMRALEAGRRAWAGEIARREAAWVVAQKEEAKARASQAVATARVAEAQQAEALAGILLEKTRIRAPFTGLVIRKDAEKGEVIAPTGAGNSRGSVLTIVDPESLEVQVELSERRIARVKQGDRAVVFLDAAPDAGMSASVRKIWPRADRSKGSIEVRVRLDERPKDLRPDMAARVVFKGDNRASSAGDAFVTVPRAAVAARSGKDVVFVLSGGVARQRTVELGKTRGTSVVVLDGLAGGERVVLDPAADLVDGSRVNEES